MTGIVPKHKTSISGVFKPGEKEATFFRVKETTSSVHKSANKNASQFPQ